MKLNVFNNNAETWRKLYRNIATGRWYTTPSCWDCEYMRVGDTSNRRKCVLFPDIIVSADAPSMEKKATGKIHAEECGHFCLDSRLPPDEGEIDLGWIAADDEYYGLDIE